MIEFVKDAFEEFKGNPAIKRILWWHWGHGKDDCLVVLDKNGKVREVRADEFRQLLSDMKTPCQVILDACRSTAFVKSLNLQSLNAPVGFLTSSACNCFNALFVVTLNGNLGLAPMPVFRAHQVYRQRFYSQFTQAVLRRFAYLAANSRWADVPELVNTGELRGFDAAFTATKSHGGDQRIREFLPSRVSPNADATFASRDGQPIKFREVPPLLTRRALRQRRAFDVSGAAWTRLRCDQSRRERERGASGGTTGPAGPGTRQSDC
jgi:hypothetical protein